MFTVHSNRVRGAVRTMVASNNKLFLASLTLSFIFWWSCSQPKRPNTVAAAATWVPSAKTGYWQICSAKQGGGVGCTVWNEQGIVLMDEGYMPLDGRMQPTGDQLLISDRPCPGPYKVCLKNGRILVPQSMFQREKAQFQRGS
jgi:hypothetical protein